MPSMGSVLERSLLVTLLMTHLGKCRRTQHESLLALHWDTMITFVSMATVTLHSSIRGHHISMVSMPDSAAFASVSIWMCEKLGVSGPEWNLHTLRLTLRCIEAYQSAQPSSHECRHYPLGGEV